MYVYPPTLAIALVPLTHLPVAYASVVWKLINFVALVGAGLILARLLNLPLLGYYTLSICAFMLLFRPSRESVFWGQITSIFILLMIAGTFYFLQRRTALAMVFFSFAIAIIPLIVWREWRVLRYITLYCTAILFLLRQSAPPRLGATCHPIHVNGRAGSLQQEHSCSFKNLRTGNPCKLLSTTR